MKKRILEWCPFQVAVLLCLAGCLKEEEFRQAEDELTGTVVSGKTTVTFDALRTGSKSSMSPEEDRIDNLAIAVFKDGKLDSYGYVVGEESITFELLEGQSYNIYASANTGEFYQIPEESDFLNICTVMTYDISEFSDRLPMCWSRKGVKVTESSQSVGMEMERLVSKIHFSVNKDLLEGLEVTAARLCQGAMAVYPFRWENGNQAIEEDGTIDGDYASEEDLQVLNDGGEIVFYALENCQGDLLPDNTDQWAKVPDNMDYLAYLCTYLEVECRFKEGFLYEGDVTYRFYAGTDNCRNFDVRRNTEQHISLTLSRDGLYRISWMVEPYISVRDGYAAGYLVEGNHPVGGLYAGEVIRYGAVLSDGLAEVLGDGILDCRIVFEADGDGGMIEFGGLEEGPGTDMYCATGTALLPGTGKILLTDRNGVRIATLEDNVRVLTPSMGFSLRESVGDDEKGFLLTSPPQCRINGGNLIFHLYLTDSDGHNLNKSAGAGFDLGVFNFPGTHLNGIPEGIGTESLSVSQTSGRSNSGGPAVTYYVRCDNDGSDPDLNDRLCSLLSGTRSITFDVNEDNLGIWGEGEFEFEVPEAVLTLVDNGWAGYHDTQMSVIVDNPSGLPLQIILWQFISSGQMWTGAGFSQNETWLEENVTIDEFGYIGTVFYPTASVNGITDWDKVSVGGRGGTILAESNGRGSSHILLPDGKEVYPVNGLTSETLRKSLVHYKLESNEMYNMFSVSPSIVPVRFIDSLSDGSEVYNIMYGSDSNGFNDQGVFGDGIGHFNNMSATKLENLCGKHLNGDTGLSIRIDSSGNIYAKTGSGSLTLSFSIKGTADGYVLTYPNGTWGKGQDNYCTANSSAVTGTFTIGSTETLVDSQTVAGIFDKIYAQTFFDSYNKIGSSNNYQHSAHPTNLSLTIMAKLAGAGTAEGYMPVKGSVSGESASYYHAQEGNTYSVGITSAFPTMRFAEVTEKASGDS
ncbi:MAG: hypothetical protein ACI395_01710 [Candidatus Cryptobacteroides sp.]